MSAPSASSTTQTTGERGSSQSMGSAAGKYGGLITRSWYKTLNNDLVQLLAYVYAEVPTFMGLHTLISFLRIIQLAGPAMLPCFDRLWDSSSSAYKTVSMLTVLFRLIPANMQDSLTQYVQGTYIALAILYLGTLVWSAKMYKKQAYLPLWLTRGISYYSSTIGHLITPMAFSFVAKDLGLMLFRSETGIDLSRLALQISTIVFAIPLIWITHYVASQSLTFRYSSLMTITNTPQSYFMLSVDLVSLVLPFAATGPKALQVAALFCGSILFMLTGLIPFVSAGFVHNWVAVCILASSISGSCTALYGGICILIGVNLSTSTLFGMIILFSVSVVMSNTILRKVTISNLRTLDLIEEDITHFENVRTVNAFLFLARTAFSMGHPVMIEWKLMKAGSERWPKCTDIWLMYAKFAAIYPEEMHTLQLIRQSISRHKLRGPATTCIKQQSIAIARMRTPSLSPDLKYKLSSISRQVQSARHRLSRVWDASIQGNLREVEVSTQSFIASRDKANAQLEHLARQFPNNRFVARTVARFWEEIMADTEVYTEWSEKTKSLQRGLSVSRDMTHELGCQAFPYIPDVITNLQIMLVPTNASSHSSDSCESSNAQLQTSDHVARSVKTLKVPAVRKAIFSRAVLCLVFSIIAVISLNMYVDDSLSSLLEPLSYADLVSQLETIITQAATFSNRLILQRLSMVAQTQPTFPNLTEFFNSWDTRDQLRYSLEELSKTIQSIEPFSKVEKNSEDFDRATSLLFSEGLIYNSYVSPTSFISKNTSIMAALIDTIVKLTPYAGGHTITTETLNSQAFLNPLSNGLRINNAIATAIDHLVSFIQYEDERLKDVAIIIFASVICGTFIIYLLLTIQEVKELKSAQESAYRCLASLPKTTVSSLAENLRSYRRDGSESESEELSRRDENTIRLLGAAAANSGKGRARGLFLIIGTGVVIAINTASFLILYSIIGSISDGVKHAAPQLSGVHGAYSYTLHAVSSLTNIALIPNPTYPSIVSTFKLEESFIADVASGQKSWSEITLNFDYVRHSVQETFVCPDRYGPPDDYRSMIECYYIDHIFECIHLFLEASYASQRDTSVPIDPLSDKLGMFFDFLISPLYDLFFRPIFNDILPEIQRNLSAELESTKPTVTALIIMSVLTEIVIMWTIAGIEKHIRDVLSILQHVPAAVLAQAPRIGEVLAGGILTVADGTRRPKEFYDAVCAQLPDAVYITDQNMKIECVNSAGCRYLGLSREEIIGRGIRELFESFGIYIASNANGVTGCEELVEIERKDGSHINLRITTWSQGQCLIAVSRDETLATRYESLIKEERARSDRLLASIIPAGMVERVQSGEKNISFAVQSATIVFIDIVEFTPWCAQLPPGTIMKTLNRYFSMLDAALTRYPTLTRIKCIGDCYMAAGGIFSEVYNPAEHARESVLFSLDALDVITTLNDEMGEKLEIRIGINTGGPVIAGVLGIGKPTFEIFGRAINLAQQMEHTGIPMEVQVSRSVYELVYGESFKIRERGTVKVKSGTAQAYLISRN